MSRFIKNHPIIVSIILSELIGLHISIGLEVYHFIFKHYLELEFLFLYAFIFGTFLVYPGILTLIHLGLLFKKVSFHISRLFDLITIILGTIYSFLVLVFYDIMFFLDWQEVLVNQQIHTPIYTKTYPTVICLVLVAFIGYFLLAYIKLEKMPPLIIVLCIAMMYVGIMESLLWIIQIFEWKNLLLCLFPFNCIVIAIKIIKYKIQEWQVLQESQKRGFKNHFLYVCNEKLMNAMRWPVAAFVLMWPLLGVIMCILLLFNQQPDYFIRSFLETSDWHLSQKVAPQNIYYDEHYLCTVAAGGHKKVVKPQRMGIRHGHKVIVNRQLCIANAFESIIEERIPRTHRVIRYIYDKYGFPIAKCIHSPFIADVIYILMKPLEWIFLIVIYCCDTQPESRIARQYLPKI